MKNATLLGFDGDGVGVFHLQSTERVARVGDEVVDSGGRIIRDDAGTDKFRRSLTRPVAHSILRSHTILKMLGRARGQWVMKNIFRNPDGEVNTQIVVAAIGATATLLTALIAGIFGLIQLQASRAQTPPTPTVNAFTVEIDGPTEAPLNEETWFTIISEDAERVEWTIAGFGSDEIDPFERSDQIFVEPVDAGRVGEQFTLVVIAYNDGNRATARHEFRIAEGK